MNLLSNEMKAKIDLFGSEAIIRLSERIHYFIICVSLRALLGYCASRCVYMQIRLMKRGAFISAGSVITLSGIAPKLALQFFFIPARTAQTHFEGA